MSYLTNLGSIARGAGLRVIETPGWMSRGGSMSSIQSVVCHHTAGAATGNMPSLNVVVNGRAGLSGPLCNYALGRDGTVYVVAAGRANHAGVVNNNALYANEHAIGIEAENTGLGEPWNAIQIDAYARLCKALITAFGLPVSRVMGHKEVAAPKGRKSDPSFDMNWFRGLVSGAGSANKSADTPKEDHMSEQLTPTVTSDGKYKFHMTLSNWDKVEGRYISMSCGWSGCSFQVFVKQANGSYIASASQMPSGSYGKTLSATLAADDAHWLGLPDGAQSFSVVITPSTADGVPSVTLFEDKG